MKQIFFFGWCSCFFAVSCKKKNSPGTDSVFLTVIELNATQQTIKGFGGTSFTPHLTSESKNNSTETAIAVTANNFTYDLHASSVTTFVSN